MVHQRYAQVFFVLGAIGAFAALVLVAPLVSIADAEAGAAIEGAAVQFSDEARVETVSFDADTTLIASYSVAGAQLLGDPAVIDPAHAQAWAHVTDVLPALYAARIRQFTVFDEGEANTVAMVHQSGVDPDAWILSIDIADAGDPTVMRETLLHELAHIITLGSADFTFAVHRDTDECDGVLLELGCATDGSLMADWATQFWADPTQPADFDRAAFVAPYAATSAHEDLAETFLYWAQGATDAEPGSVLAAKFTWFDRQGDLVGARWATQAASPVPHG